MKQKTYAVTIAGKTEQLPILPLSSGVSIAFFNLHGNTFLTERCAEQLAPSLKECDVLLTAESKGLQLCHCIARLLNHPFYAVARKTKKLYTRDGISAEVQSITTGGAQTLYLSAADAALLKGKRVGIVDDVISTGGSLKGMEILVEKAGGTTVKKAAVLAEGDAKERTDIVYLAVIPIMGNGG